MRDYSKFTANDFVMDEYFQSWVINPDENTSAFWTAWLAEHREKTNDVEEARHILQYISFSSYTLSGEDVSRLWSRIRDVDKSQKASEKQKGTTWYTAAAVIVLVVIVTFVSLWNRNAMLEYQTAYGETRSIILPDGSSVVLNSNSTLKLFSHWREDQDREIWLEGEAYFSVQHKQNNQRFRVTTVEGVAVEVLGTTFNVYHRTHATKVVLNSGSIRLSLPVSTAQEHDIIMEPGELVEYKAEKVIRRKVDPEVYSAWTENKFILNHTSLHDIVRTLKENYNVTVEVPDQRLLNETISGSMPLEDADLLVNQVAKAFRLKVKQEGQKFILVE